MEDLSPCKRSVGFPRAVNAALWNAEHASQASQVANRFHQLNGTFKVQVAVDTALKNEVIKEAFTVLAKMLSSRKKKAMSKKVIMRFMALLDDMHGNVFFWQFSSHLNGTNVVIRKVKHVSVGSGL